MQFVVLGDFAHQVLDDLQMRIEFCRGDVSFQLILRIPKIPTHQTVSKLGRRQAVRAAITALVIVLDLSPMVILRIYLIRVCFKSGKTNIEYNKKHQ